MRLTGQIKKTPNVGGVRYAPSPTGVLHLGNLRTAWISQKLAKAIKQPWVVRFEDIDKPRVKAGAIEQQTSDLLALGLKPEHTFIQSDFNERHWQLFLTALEAGEIYPCSCSRQDVAADLAGLASASHSNVQFMYSGKCRYEFAPPEDKTQQIAWRFKNTNSSGHADFIIARASLDKVHAKSAEDFTPAYHWACAIDDYDGAHEVLVRAADLKSAANLQRAIQERLAQLEGKNFTAPAVFHTALIVQNDGHRLEKRTGGVTLAELAQKDISPEEVLARFEQSFLEASIQKFIEQTGFRKGLIFSEEPAQLSLEELEF